MMMIMNQMHQYVTFPGIKFQNFLAAFFTTYRGLIVVCRAPPQISHPVVRGTPPDAFGFSPSTYDILTCPLGNPRYAPSLTW